MLRGRSDAFVKFIAIVARLSRDRVGMTSLSIRTSRLDLDSGYLRGRILHRMRSAMASLSGAAPQQWRRPHGYVLLSNSHLTITLRFCFHYAFNLYSPRYPLSVSTCLCAELQQWL